MFYFIYYASFIVVLPGILFALICQLLVTIRFKKYSRVQSSSQWTANEMSDMLLEKQGIRSVEIRKVDGSLTDNYNPSTDVLSLSESVYSGTDIALYSLSTLFALVTLPVEFDASRRAMRMLAETGVMNNDELRKTRRVLTAAAMTYVASLLVSLLYLLRFILIVGSVKSRRND